MIERSVTVYGPKKFSEDLEGCRPRQELIKLADSDGACVLSISGANLALSPSQTAGLLKILSIEPDVRPAAGEPEPLAMGEVTVGCKDHLLLFEDLLVWHHLAKVYFWRCNELAGIDQMVHGMSTGDEAKTAAAVAAIFEK